MNPEPQDLAVARELERLEARMWEDAVRAAAPEVAAAFGLRVEPVAGGIALIASGFPHLLYNRAFAFALDQPLDEATLDRMIALYRRDLPFSIQPAPFARPYAIGAWLAARGHHALFDWVIWQRPAHPPVAAPSAARVERIGVERAELWHDVALTVFASEAPLRPWLLSLVGRERWSHYVATLDDAPAGVGAMFVDGDHAWLGWGATLAGSRGRGVQSAIIQRRLADAAAAGAKWIRVETAPDTAEKPNPSYRNMARAGFEVSHLRPSHNWLPPATK